MKDIIKKIQSIVNDNRVYENELLKEHTYFKIGGPAKILVKVKSIDEIKKVIQICKDEDVKYYVIGNGTNILVPDEGLDAVIIKIAETFNDYRIHGNKVYVQAGMLLSTLSKKIAKASLTGFEFASGIPGTVGGAIYMNAGAYGGEMKDIVEYAKVLDSDGKVQKILNKDLELGYRKSIVSKKNYVVLSVCFVLKEGNIDQIKKEVQVLDEKRISKQPLDLPSAGSTFKRPEGYYAGKLIDDAGLRGFRFRDAQVSDKHCGFVVNRGNATCKDVLQLIDMVKKVVFDQFNVTLEREVRILGRD
ncbi:MAG TPA: UDP-N-acetylmuramate dehydrogenase [Clostridia bacterium]|nr:UDP-N-acetylmuramate dehydrogenase [Clostridia bacterium]